MAFAARAVDDVGNTGEVSNVVVVGISDVIDPGSINGLVINEVIESEAVVEIEFGATGDDGVEGKGAILQLFLPLFKGLCQKNAVLQPPRMSCLSRPLLRCQNSR